MVFVVVLYATTLAGFPLFLAIARTDAQLASSALMLRGTDSSAERQIRVATRLRRIKMLSSEQRQRCGPTQSPTANLNEDSTPSAAVGVTIERHISRDSCSAVQQATGLYTIPVRSDSLFKEKHDDGDLHESPRSSENVYTVLPLLRHHPYANNSTPDESTEQLHSS